METRQVHLIRRVLLSSGELSISIAINIIMKMVCRSIQKKKPTGVSKLYDEIVQGYQNGTRERYVEDETSETGYRKITMEEELNELDKAFRRAADGADVKEMITSEFQRLSSKAGSKQTSFTDTNKKPHATDDEAEETVGQKMQKLVCDKYNTPSIIKYPFWYMANKWSNVTYACLNMGEGFVPEEIRHKSICVNEDIYAAFHEISAQPMNS